MKSALSNSENPRPTGWRNRLRWLLMVVVFVAMTAAVYLSAAQSMIDRGIPHGPLDLYVSVLVSEKVNALPPRRGRSSTRIAFLGDSTVEGYPKGLDVASQTGRALRRKRVGQFDVVSFAQPGMGPLEYYSLAESFLSARPDVLVISFNVSSLSPQARDFWARRSLVGWIPPSRILKAATMPFFWWGITLDRLLLYIAGVQAEVVEPWFKYRLTQSRAGNAVKQIRRRAQGITDDRIGSFPPQPIFNHPTKANRFARPAVLQNLGDAADGADVDHPVFEMLAGAIDIYRENGVEVFVYATPTNVEHMEDVGVDTMVGLRTTINNLERVATGHGARFLDLHRMFPDEAFRDTGNHLVYEGDTLGPQELGQRLAYWIAEHRAALVPRSACR